MAYKFGKRSEINLVSAHPDLERVARAAIKDYDFTVICSYRGRAEQEAAFRSGKSRARHGQSPHNFKPSLAIDIVPYPLNWNDTAAFEAMGAVFMKHAARLGVRITWGRNFKGLVDMPHFELTNWRSLV